MKYKIYAGSLNGATYKGTYECKDEQEAWSLAYEYACDDFNIKEVK